MYVVCGGTVQSVGERYKNWCAFKHGVIFDIGQTIKESNYLILIIAYIASACIAQSGHK